MVPPKKLKTRVLASHSVQLSFSVQQYAISLTLVPSPNLLTSPMALQRFSASSSSCGSGSSSDSASSTRSASASEDDEPPAKKAKGLEDPDSMRNLSWNQLQSMDAEDPSILSNQCSSLYVFS